MINMRELNFLLKRNSFLGDYTIESTTFDTNRDYVHFGFNIPIFSLKQSKK